AEDLRRFRNGEPIQARRLSPWERAHRGAARQPALAALVAVITLVAVVGFPLVFLLWQSSEKGRGEAVKARHEAEIARAEAERGRTEAENAKHEAEWQLAFNRINLARFDLETNNVAGAAELLAQVPPTGRNWEWHYLTRARYQGFVRTLQPNSGEVTSVAFS